MELKEQDTAALPRGKGEKESAVVYWCFRFLAYLGCFTTTRLELQQSIICGMACNHMSWNLSFYYVDMECLLGPHQFDITWRLVNCGCKIEASLIVVVQAYFLIYWLFPFYFYFEVTQFFMQIGIKGEKCHHVMKCNQTSEHLHLIPLKK